jgi:hypothetical protein
MESCGAWPCGDASRSQGRPKAGLLLHMFHLPPDAVRDRWASDDASGPHRDCLFLPQGWTRFRRESSENIL